MVLYEKNQFNDLYNYVYHLSDNNAYVVNDYETALYTDNIKDGYAFGIVATVDNNVIYRFLLHENYNIGYKPNHSLTYILDLLKLLKSIHELKIVCCSMKKFSKVKHLKETEDKILDILKNSCILNGEIHPLCNIDYIKADALLLDPNGKILVDDKIVRKDRIIK